MNNKEKSMDFIQVLDYLSQFKFLNTDINITKNDNIDYSILESKDTENKKPGFRVYNNYSKHSIDKQDNKYTHLASHESKKALYFNLFREYTKKQHDTIDNFICSEYINITKGLVKVLATKCNNKFAMDIVNKGYNDNIFDDLTQEVAIVLYENKQDIKNDNGYFDISDIIIKCFRVLNKYAYQQKKYYDNCVYDIVGFDENTQEDIILKTNTQIYNNYCLACADELTDIQVAQFNKIIEIVKNEIKRTQKDKASAKILQVFDLILQGYPKKDIKLFMDLSDTTITKYHKIIKDCFYNVFRKPYYINKHKKQEKYSVNNNFWFTEKRQNTNYNNIVLSDTYFMDYTDCIESIYKRNKLKYNTLKSIKQDNIKSQRMDTYIY